MQQVYATQTPSMPIPVPIPSAHSRLTMAAQPMAVHPHHALPFGAHAMAVKSQFRPTASPRFPGAVVQAPHIRTMGAPHVHQEARVILQGSDEVGKISL